jgi:hypothetical protein
MVKFLHLLFAGIVLPGMFYGCNVSDEIEPIEYNLNGPIEFMIRGEIHDDILFDQFEINVEWTKNEFNESVARFFISSRDTINSSDIWKRYMLTITRNNEWPMSGDFGVVPLAELQKRETGQFFISLKSIYREVLLDQDQDEFFLNLDHQFTATNGNVSILSFSENKLMAEFEIIFRMDEKVVHDPIWERREGPVENALSILGLFVIDLQQNRVSQLSSW